MAAASRPPGPSFARFIDWRASRIEDPVERLRFLKHTTSPRPTIGERFRTVGGWRLVISALLWATVFVPAYAPSRGRGTSATPTTYDSRTHTSFAVHQVWPVERTANFDLYSNGLRIENEFRTSGKPRVAFPLFRPKVPKRDLDQEEPAAWRSEPAGIVFHSTESHQVPFQASEIRDLKRIGRNLLDYIRSQQSYHFVIDRFGRVFRVVAEDSIANHSGKSVWSDEKGTYVNLNGSFLSVAFESQTDAPEALSAAQIHAAKVLTDMLRAKFGIAASNCVTHAQVSVNPKNWRIGYHTDWANGFPFAELGLPDNYRQVLPSMFQFGFDYDDAFVAAAGRPWSGLAATNRLMEEQARADGLSLTTYRQRLQDRYRRISAQLRSNEETQDEKY
jgi:hypothetical protein